MGNFYSRIKRLFGGGGVQTSRPTPRATEHVRVGYHDLYELLTRYEHMESLYRMNKLDSSELSEKEICTIAAKRVVYGLEDPEQSMMFIMETIIPVVKQAMVERTLLRVVDNQKMPDRANRIKHDLDSISAYLQSNKMACLKQEYLKQQVLEQQIISPATTNIFLSPEEDLDE